MLKSVANQVEKVLPKITQYDQAGYANGRSIGKCIRTTDDVMFFIHHINVPGIALFLDFKKAFDLLHHYFLQKALKTYNFGVLYTLVNNII